MGTVSQEPTPSETSLLEGINRVLGVQPAPPESLQDWEVLPAATLHEAMSKPCFWWMIRRNALSGKRYAKPGKPDEWQHEGIGIEDFAIDTANMGHILGSITMVEKYLPVPEVLISRRTADELWRLRPRQYPLEDLVWDGGRSWLHGAFRFTLDRRGIMPDKMAFFTPGSNFRAYRRTFYLVGQTFETPNWRLDAILAEKAAYDHRHQPVADFSGAVRGRVKDDPIIFFLPDEHQK